MVASVCATGFAERNPARTGTDWEYSCYSPAGRPGIVAMLRSGTADCRRHRHFYTSTTHRFVR
jgi:hypothetical protein